MQCQIDENQILQFPKPSQPSTHPYIHSAVEEAEQFRSSKLEVDSQPFTIFIFQSVRNMVISHRNIMIGSADKYYTDISIKRRFFTHLIPYI